MPAPTNMNDVSQFMGRLTPTERPRVQPLCRRLLQMKCVVTSEEEQAVSMLMLGPCTGGTAFKQKIICCIRWAYDEVSGPAEVQQ